MDAVATRKQTLLTALRAELQRELAIIVAAAKFTHAAATHEDSKPENDKDTRGLELAYLAGAQAERAREIEAALAILDQVKALALAETAAVQAGALVRIDQAGTVTEYFLLPVGGGKQMGDGVSAVRVLTPTSPLGSAILGLRAGDETEVEARGSMREVTVLAVS